MAIRPPRLSFSQDHWGYFNGRANTGLIPEPQSYEHRSKFPLATANREASPLCAGNGLLNKVVYPTGGTQLIDHESNEENIVGDPGYYSTPHELSWSVTGIGAGVGSPNTQVVYFTIDHMQMPELWIDCVANGPIEIIHNTGMLDIEGPIDPAHPSRPVPTVFHSPYTPPYRVGPIKLGTDLYNGPLSPGTYKCTLYARGNVVTNNIRIRYNPVLTGTGNRNAIVGGMRVKRITSTTGNGATPTIKRYYYGEMATKDISSLFHIAKPQYYKTTKSTVKCESAFRNSISVPHQAYCYGAVLFSNSLSNLFNYSGAPVSYGAVVEGIGENMEGGAIETRYHARSDEPDYVLWGEAVPGSTLTNFSSLFNGKLREQTVYRTTASGTQVPLQKKIYNYVVDSSLFKMFKGYSVNKKYNIVVPVPTGSSPTKPVVYSVMDAYDLLAYEIYSAWTHPGSVTDISYDEDGLNPVSTLTKQYFDNAAHQQLTRTEVTNSKSQVVTTTFKYPGDLGGNAVYDELVAKNILTPVINTQQKVTDGLTVTPVMEQQTDYAYNIFTGNCLPAAVKSSVKGNALEVEGSMDLYDPNGNLLQYTNRSGIPTAIIFGYGNRYPIAKVEGATYADAIAQLSVIPATLQTMDGAALRTELDRIRTGLSTASVTTYTYRPGIGLVSVTDPNNRTNTYEYDLFNRLAVISDQDGNVVKKHEYAYAGAADPNTIIYYNAALKVSARCNNCIAGYTGSMVDYTVLYGSYYSYVSQADADAQAAADAATNKQSNADRYGICSMSEPW